MDRILHRSVPAALVLGAALLLAPPAMAGRGDADSPVARVLRVDGTLRLQRGADGDLGADELRAERRSPVREGDRLRSAAGSRTEIAFGSDRLRLDENSVLSVRRLSAGRIELRLEQGRLALLLEGDDDPLRWRIETAAAMHRPQGPGLFRIDAPESARWLDGAAATAWRSPMHLESADDSLLLQPGRRAELEGRRGWQTGLPVADRFARWAMDDTRERWDGQDEDGRRSSLRPRAPVELPDDIDGVDTLDRHGRWEHASDWGWVWVPRASLSWAPYRQGRWRRSADGWLWIDSAPWGVATFRHGRWVRWDSHWACAAPRRAGRAGLGGTAAARHRAAGTGHHRDPARSADLSRHAGPARPGPAGRAHRAGRARGPGHAGTGADHRSPGTAADAAADPAAGARTGPGGRTAPGPPHSRKHDVARRPGGRRGTAPRPAPAMSMR